MLTDFDKFKNREIKAKDIFDIRIISKDVAYDFVRRYHYLGDAKFFSVQSFGLFYTKSNTLVGVATYSLPQGTEATSGWFSLDSHTRNIYELSRLCMLPQLNGTNATSFLLGGSIKMLKAQNNKEKEQCKRMNIPFTEDKWICRAIITLALGERHVGSIYQVCNFKYYGMTDLKGDFYRDDGAKNPRGKVSQWHGVWLPRPRKHRYAYILDESLKCNYPESDRPNSTDIMDITPCCHGTHEVFDNRYREWYTCPICTGKIRRIYKDDNGNTIKIDTCNEEDNSKKAVDLW